MLERGTARKVAVIALVIMTIALVAVGVVILFQIQSQQDPDSSYAYGFGSSAIRTNFEKVENAFKTANCTSFLNDEKFKAENSLLMRDFALIGMKAVDNPLNGANMAKNCQYTFDKRTAYTIDFQVYSYKYNSEIPANANTLHKSINGTNMKSNTEFIASGEMVPGIYYYANPSKSDPLVCQINIFDFQNDFQYATVTMKGFALPNCDNIHFTLRRFAALFSTSINETMQTFRINSSSRTSS